MTITICGNCVEFGSCTMCDTPTGFTFRGDIKAGSGFCQLPTHAQGTDRGYVSGGYSSPINRCAIQRFAFTSDGEPKAFVGCLATPTGGAEGGAGASSSTHGYIGGGRRDPGGGGGYGPHINKFPFATDSANATCIGDLNDGRCAKAGNMSTTTGYAAGGRHPGIDVIDKYPFASDTNATDSGDLLCEAAKLAGHSSRTHGYFSGGSAPPANAPVIQKFPFASNGNTTDVGDLAQARVCHAGQNSAESGYITGGTNAAQSGCLNNINKWPFATDTNATDIGDLACCRQGAAGVSSGEDGYTATGDPNVNQIERFPFSSDTNSTSIGTIHFQVTSGHGHQC
jgi:hypothetical protein